MADKLGLVIHVCHFPPGTSKWNKVEHRLFSFISVNWRGRRAIDETGCEGVMVGRRAIEHPWVFREARALLDRGEEIPLPTPAERLALCREHLIANVEQRGEPFGVHCTRRHLAGNLKGLPGAAALRRELNTCDSLDGCLAILDAASHRVAAAA